MQSKHDFIIWFGSRIFVVFVLLWLSALFLNSGMDAGDLLRVVGEIYAALGA